MKILERAQEILDIEIEELQRVRNDLGPDFSHAVEVILQCLKQDGKIVVTGIGKSYHIGQKISATLASTGSTSVMLHPSQALHGDMGMLNAKDVLLVLSYSGESDELLELIPAVKRCGVKIVALTGCATSALAKHSDAIIKAAVTREACPFNMAPTASTTATLAVGDALAIVLLEARGFKKEDFAKLHPGGSIGRTLLLRVSDLMRKDDRVAKVPLTATIKDAILAMTSARSGSVAIVTPDQQVAGIFTDGDLRRLVSQNQDVTATLIRTVMTPGPITVRETSLAVDVLKIYEDHNIDDVLVTDDDGCLVGMVDIQDLPKFKIL